jgi:hypothetical protein
MNRLKRILHFAVIFMIIHIDPGFAQELSVSFSGKKGQLEIGSIYTGAEFHHSRPLPSRISFYYPVANSIDLSTGYWERDQSLPFQFFIRHNGKTDTIGYRPCIYRYTPCNAVFQEEQDQYSLSISYRFADDMPLMILTLQLRNRAMQTRKYEILGEASLVLRTSHTYALRPPSGTAYRDKGAVYVANYDYQDTDSAIVFIANAGEMPAPSQKLANNQLFTYHKILSQNQILEIVWLIGSGKEEDAEKINSLYRLHYKQSAVKDSLRVKDYTLTSLMKTGDVIVDQTARWSKAVMTANRHYLDDQIVPMPCPAEYNFFFTHDVLLTDLGAINFDPVRVKKDLLYLKSLTGPDSILPHAYYWKDGKYVTELCGTDNWNHFWFIILSNSYLKHCGDLETVRQLYPVLAKSIQMVRTNIESDGLMYASRPDWWDIGHIYGAQSYVTLLMIRALQDYVSLTSVLNIDQDAAEFIALSGRMKNQLLKKLWNEEKGYLFNMIDSLQSDDHYYSGSMIAAAFDILEDQYKSRLLDTAEKQLLDRNLGIRNAMPADFHLLTDRYKFQQGEVGAPYIYANGGVWPQGTIWYGMGLLESGQVENSLQVLKKYLTLQGIADSPNGQPSFYEYRNADFASADYGKIDKPTFLWAGGLYLYYLYHLAGVRENAWSIYFSPDIPSAFSAPEYDLVLDGRVAHVKWKGQGRYFKHISRDGQRVYSSVVYQPAGNIVLEKGVPEYPYLAEISAGVESVDFDAEHKKLKVVLHPTSGREIEFTLISPQSLGNITLNKKNIKGYTQFHDQGVFNITGKIKIPDGRSEFDFQF